MRKRIVSQLALFDQSIQQLTSLIRPTLVLRKMDKVLLENSGFVDLIHADTLGKSVTLAMFGLIAAVVAYVVRYYGYELIRRGDLLHSKYGLLTVRSGSLSRERIQAPGAPCRITRRAMRSGPS